MALPEYDEDEIQEPQEFFHSSQILDSHLKINVALALAVEDIIMVNDGSLCLSCAQAQVKSISVSGETSEADKIHRKVINMLSSPTENLVKGSLKRKAIEASHVRR